MDRLLVSASVLTLILAGFLPVRPTSFRLVNKCRYTVWPGLLSGAGTTPLPTTGFVLKPSDSKSITIPKSWSGRIWGRTHCGKDSTGKFCCLTGDCGSGKLQCLGGGAKPPATLAEFTLNGASGLDFYDVSLVDGYNIPMLVVAKGGTCSATGCLVDLNGACPSDLRVTHQNGRGTVACRSACEAFGAPQFCCSEEYSTPDTCRPSVYSVFFKSACPRAYSYAYDDKTSTFTCASTDYVIVFCPAPFTSERMLGWRRRGGELPLVNTSFMYFHNNHGSGDLTRSLPKMKHLWAVISLSLASLIFSFTS